MGAGLLTKRTVTGGAMGAVSTAVTADRAQLSGGGRVGVRPRVRTPGRGGFQAGGLGMPTGHRVQQHSSQRGRRSTGRHRGTERISAELGGRVTDAADQCVEKGGARGVLRVGAAAVVDDRLVHLSVYLPP